MAKDQQEIRRKLRILNHVMVINCGVATGLECFVLARKLLADSPQPEGRAAFICRLRRRRRQARYAE
jgi:hypothetical protein